MKKQIRVKQKPETVFNNKLSTQSYLWANDWAVSFEDLHISFMENSAEMVLTFYRGDCTPSIRDPLALKPISNRASELHIVMPTDMTTLAPEQRIRLLDLLRNLRTEQGRLCYFNKRVRVSMSSKRNGKVVWDFAKLKRKTGISLDRKGLISYVDY